MRGKRAGVLPLGLPVRIIPAHAGQTICRFCSLLSVPDHPRACGANMASKGKIDFQTGSSPRMRGKLGADAGSTELDRIIPAHAGQTCSRGAKARPTPDHPRACGANDSLYHRLDFAHGSSPRMRGKPTPVCGTSLSKRIIPAHAGQTAVDAANRLGRTDHPRACGANDVAIPRTLAKSGSSPRMRGKLARDTEHIGGIRIIPAHAGQTCFAEYSFCRSADHPRACGANAEAIAQAAAEDGSSPRMRGKLVIIVPINAAQRIIPAHAGQTTRVDELISPVSNHPRACGANLLGQITSHVTLGSSPRMRGKPNRSINNTAAQRIIPAHAGQTLSVAGLLVRKPDHPRACGANFCDGALC